MRIVAISDTHGQYRDSRLVIPDGDVLIHCGDALNRGTLAELRTFAQWLDNKPHKHKILISGNHDWCWQREPDAALSLLGDSTTYLCDTMVTIDGVNFYGSPWTPRFYQWAFMKDRGGDMKQIWDALRRTAESNPIDVLITHGPAYGHGDNAPRKRRAGCLELLHAIKEVRPKVHLCGHIHEGHGLSYSDEIEGTLFANVSICTGDYKPTNPATVITI
jgi:Icc-related predicted phosphoesterase